VAPHVTAGVLGTAHAIWLLRRASVLEGISGGGGETPDSGRAALFHRIADAVWRAAAGSTAMRLTPQERAALNAEADALSTRAAAEIRRAGPRNLEGSEEWVLTARALREVAEAARE
jgi:hypothetical protein